MKDRRLSEVLRHLQPPSGTKLWHGGATVIGSLRAVSAEVAAWKPYEDRHSIWDLALHIAYWNYAVQRRITDAPKGAFPRSPSNWPIAPAAASKAAWDRDRELVQQSHDDLIEAVDSFDPARLDELAGDDTKTTYADLITGILLHDTYHVGQIQLLKRLAESHGM